MLTFVLSEKTENNVVYKYYPDGNKNAEGSVSYNIKQESGKIEKLSPEDEVKWYAMHMFSQIRKFVKSKNFEESGMVAWY